MAQKGKGNLTAKQEKFCQSIADGMNQSDAYRSAYSTTNMSKQVLWNKAFLLADRDEVGVRISELRSNLAKKNLWTREMSVKILGNIALSQSGFENNKIAAIKELNAMHGYNAPTKIDLNNLNPMVIVRHGDNSK